MRALKCFFLTVLVLFTVNLKCSFGILDGQFIIDFFRAKYCTVGTVFSCLTKQEQFIFAKNFSMEQDLRVSFFSLNDQTPPCEQILHRGHHHLAIILDADCSNIEPFIRSCANLHFFYTIYHWLAFASTVDVISKFEHVSLAINADLVVAVPDSDDNETWTLYDVYNPSYNHSGRLNVTRMGYYNKQDGYQNELKEPKYFRRRNMTGISFKTGMVIPEDISIPLQDYLDSEAEPYNNTFTRYTAVTNRICQDFYNYSRNVTQIKSWGYEQPDGDVDGLVKALKSKWLDFGEGALMFKDYRLRVLDFAYGNWIVKSIFIFRHPKSTLTSYELYLRPLVTSVWVATMVTLLLIVIMLRLTVIKENKVLDNTSPNENSWSYIILYGIGEISQQGFSFMPQLVSTKIIVFVVLIFSFMIYQFYSASVVSLLLLVPPHTIVTLLDLLNSPLKAACEDILYDRDYLAKTTDPVAIKLFNTKIKGSTNSSGFLPPPAGLKKVEAGDFAFHTQTSTSYPIIERTFEEKTICELAEVQMYPTQFVYTCLQKGSPFKDMFNYCLAYQKEVGVVERLRKVWDARRPVCLEPTNYFEITVGLHESYWALILLGLGMAISFIILAMEIAWFRRKDVFKKAFRKKRKSKPNLKKNKQ